MTRCAAVILLAFATGATAQTCPDPADKTEERAQLFQALRLSKDEPTGNAAANAIWALWTKAPDAKAQNLLDQGMAALSQGAYAISETKLDALVAYCPEYAEGWNQRAFARYLSGDDEGSVADIERTLSLEPDHFGALAGLAMILINRGESGKAKAVIKHAVSVHPWLKERAFLHEIAPKDI